MKPDLDELERDLKQMALDCAVIDWLREEEICHDAIALIADLRAKDRRLDAAVKVIERIKQHHEIGRAGEMYTNDTDLAANMAAMAAGFLFPKETNNG